MGPYLIYSGPGSPLSSTLSPSVSGRGRRWTLGRTKYALSLALRPEKHHVNVSEQKAKCVQGPRKALEKTAPEGRRRVPDGIIRTAVGRARQLVVRPQATLDTIHDALSALAARYRTDEVLTAVKLLPAREAIFRPMPGWVRPELVEAYRAKGIDQLYSHQAAAAELAREGKDFVVVTPTASGKTLCYNLPVLNAVLENTDTRALYLYPTKALAQDQLAELHDLADAPGRSLRRLHLRRRHAAAMREGHPRARPHRCSRIPTCCIPASCRTTPLDAPV